MTEHNDLQHKLVNDVYAELGTISKHSQDVIDYLMRHGWIRTPDEAESAARGEMPRRTMDKQELIKKIADEYAHLAPAVDTIINAAEHEGWLRNPDQAPGRTMKKSDYQELMDGTSLSYGVGFTDGFHMAGGSIVPDPEPTDVEKITRLILENSTDMDPKFIAEMLVENGVRPVKAGGDDDH